LNYSFVASYHSKSQARLLLCLLDIKEVIRDRP